MAKIPLFALEAVPGYAVVKDTGLVAVAKVSGFLRTETAAEANTLI